MKDYVKMMIIICITASIGTIIHYYVKPSDYYFSESDKTIQILSEYPHPSLLLSALKSNKISCSELTNETKLLINAYKEGTC